MPNCNRCCTVIADTHNADGTPFCDSCYTNCYTDCNECGCELSLNNTFSVGEWTLCYDCYGIANTCNCCCEPYFNGHRDVNGVCISCGDTWYRSCGRCGNLTHTDDMEDGRCHGCLRPRDWRHTGFSEPNISSELRSNRKFGIELETSQCNGYENLFETTCYGCVRDGSVDGMEFVSPVLYGDNGLRVTRELCDELVRRDYQVDTACGYHLHCDLTGENEENCRKVALAYHYTYSVWLKFFRRERGANYYCAPHPYNATMCRVVPGFRDFINNAYQGDKYFWCNWNSYLNFGTVEIRIHDGTIASSVVTNWVKAHLRFIDAIVTMTWGDITRKFGSGDDFETLAALMETWNDNELESFYLQRAERFNQNFTPIEELV